MKIADVIDKLEERHVSIDSIEHTCDGVICGDVSRDCTGIILTCCATVALIKKTIENGYNLIVCHEPVFYHGYDETGDLEGLPVYEKKRALIEENGIVIYRDHDHVHMECPDMIYSGIVRKLGWEPYAVSDRFFPSSEYHIPEMSLHELVEYVGNKLNIDGIRIIGNPQMRVRTVGITGHFFGGQEDQDCIREIEEKDYDVVIPLETVDWTIIEYLMDSESLGRPRAMLNAGHFNLEEPGMEMMAHWVGEAVEYKVPVKFLQSGNMYGWHACKKRQ